MLKYKLAIELAPYYNVPLPKIGLWTAQVEDMRVRTHTKAKVPRSDATHNFTKYF